MKLNHILLSALICAAVSPAFAGQSNNPSMLKDFNFEKPAFIHDLPFAKHNVVVQVDSANPADWTLALNNVQNLINYFGQGNLRANVVAYGPGLKMLLKNSPMAQRITSQNSEGVEFDACHNTMEAMAKKHGKMPELVSDAVVVPAGVVRIMQLEQAGFDYLKP